MIGFCSSSDNGKLLGRAKEDDVGPSINGEILGRAGGDTARSFGASVLDSFKPSDLGNGTSSNSPRAWAAGAFEATGSADAIVASSTVQALDAIEVNVSI